MSTKRDKGKLKGKVPARVRMEFDSTHVSFYLAKSERERKTKLGYRLRPKGMNVALAAVYPATPSTNTTETETLNKENV